MRIRAGEATVSEEAMRGLEGSRVSVALSGGDRLDDCQLVSAPRGRGRSVWLFDGGIDVFVPVSDIVALWESASPSRPRRN
jgi:hypothetical protein